MTDQTIARSVRPDCDCAVESGSVHGETARLLASYPNFEEIHTVELAPALYEAARARFDADRRVRCWLGDSGSRFEQIFRELERNANPLYTEGLPPMDEIYACLARINPAFEISIDHAARPLSILVANAA